MLKNIKKIQHIFLWIFLSLIVESCGKSNAASTMDAVLLVTTNVQGQLDPCGWKNNPLGGLPRRYSYINQVKQSGIDPILLDAGDALFDNQYLVPSKEESSKLKANTILSTTQNMGEYLYNVGNHDFAAGYEFLVEMQSKYDIGFISSNIVKAGTDDLAFLDHKIFDRNGIKIGVFGLMQKIPSFVKEVEVNDLSEVARNKIEELRPQVDILVLLLNADKKAHNELSSDLKSVDYVFLSRETTRTRPEAKQPENGPLKYCFGIQGKYVGRFDIKIADKSKPIEDITAPMMTIKTFEARLNNLQKKDPSKPLEEIYRSNLNALNLIARLKQGIKDSKEKTSNLTNSSYFNLIYLNSRVPSEKATLNLVNETLKTCDELDKEGKKISP